MGELLVCIVCRRVPRVEPAEVCHACQQDCAIVIASPEWLEPAEEPFLPAKSYRRPAVRGFSPLVPVLVISAMLALFLIAGIGVYLNHVNPIPKPQPRQRKPVPDIVVNDALVEAVPPGSSKPGPGDSTSTKPEPGLEMLHRLDESLMMLPTAKLETAPPLPISRRKPAPGKNQPVAWSKEPPAGEVVGGKAGVADW